MEGVGRRGCVGSIRINSFFSFSFPFLFFSGAKYWDLATGTCNLCLFIYTLLYFIYGS